MLQQHKESQRISSISAWLLSTAKSTASLTIIDQVFVSGTRFLTMIAVGRFAGASELGLYAIGFAAVVLSICVQESLITTPYTVLAGRYHGLTRAVYAGGSFLQHICLSIIAVIVLGTIMLLTQFAFDQPEFALILLHLMSAVPMTLLRDFIRRIEFARMKMSTVLIFDATTSAIQIGALIYFVSGGDLTAATAFSSMALACGITSTFWLIFQRRTLLIRLHLFQRDWSKNWRFGRWMLGVQITAAITGYMPIWLLAWLLGTMAVGTFTACESLVLLSNPIIIGLNNFTVPKFALVYLRGGRRELSYFVWFTTVAIIVCMLVLVVGILLFGDLLMRLLYGNEFHNFEIVLVVMSFSMLVWAVGTVLGAGLLAMEKASANFKARLIGLIITLLSCGPLILSFGTSGAAISLFVANLAIVLHNAYTFRKLVQQPVKYNK